MKSIKAFISMAVVLMGVQLIGAQPSMPSRVEVFVPAALDKKIVTNDELSKINLFNDWGQNAKANTRKHWIANSDRSDNVCYTSPTSKTAHSTLNFGEEVIIARIHGDMALVYQDQKPARWPAYSERAIVKGWIPMKNLVLTKSAPAEADGVTKKYIMAATLDNVANRKTGYKYYNPDGTGERSAASEGNLCYIYKHDAASDRYLVGIENGNDPSGYRFLGWTDKSNLHSAAGNIYLEPNWKPADVAAFNDPEGKSYPIYTDKKMTTPGAYYQYGVVNDKDSKPSTRYRLDPYRMRYPLLSIEDNDGNPAYKMIAYSAGKKIDNPDSTSIQEAFLKKRLGEKLYNELKENPQSFMFNGYVPVKDDQGRAYWNMVTLLSQDELDQLIDRLKPLYDTAAAGSVAKRQAFIDATKALARKVAPKASKDDVNNMSLAEIILLAAGVDAKMVPTNGASLGKLQKLDSEEYAELIDGVKTMFENLCKNVRESEYPYSFKNIGDVEYYWLPVEDITLTAAATSAAPTEATTHTTTTEATTAQEPQEYEWR